MNKTILIADDERDIVRLIADSLSFEPFHLLMAYSGKEALEILETEPVDFLILDIMMPGFGGLEVLRRIRENNPVHILLLSAMDRDIDKVTGFEIGADDYMTKPFSVEELVSKVRAHFRKMDRLERNWKSDTPDLLNPVQTADEPLMLNPSSFEVFQFGERLDFSAKEFQILYYLASHPNQVLSREQIYEHVWGDEHGDYNTVTVHIKNIRKKLGKSCDVIKTIWGYGYKFILRGLVK
ncbi:response regulator transcription factor [Paenibacillus sp. N3.4]|uniref:response regulator transcription factor n=1 Tax=Paenibacillus sp. N3.4 TaxID=2603222 RepID=UPI0011C97946|nr:response regulator transcription factor [Paenibacillus sp. N3.4]TXK80390.1 response regulator transcription factor [Paenibacillus sp. N3.4]